MEIDAHLEQRDKIILALMILLVLFFGFLYYLKNKPPSLLNYPTDNTTIVAFGDSLVEGVGSSDNGGFVTKLEFLLEQEVINLGVAGDTTLDGLIRLEEVIDQEPGLVIISLGGNDFLQRKPVGDVMQNMNKIISRLQNEGSMVMLLAVPGYRGMHRDLSEQHDAGYISNILSGLIGRDRYMSDAIHPNDAGYDKIAERIAPEVRKLYK